MKQCIVEEDSSHFIVSYKDEGIQFFYHPDGTWRGNKSSAYRFRIKENAERFINNYPWKN